MTVEPIRDGSSTPATWYAELGAIVAKAAAQLGLEAALTASREVEAGAESESWRRRRLTG